MTKVQIYDQAMCCSTGVCGPQVDPVLPRFAADLEWLKAQGHSVTRFNLAQEPREFVKNQVVQQMLSDDGVACLPVVIVDDHVVSRGEYPTRASLATWTGTEIQPDALLPLLSDSESCCDQGPNDCC